MSQEFTQRLYQNAQAQQSADAPVAPAPVTAPSDDEVADAEIVDDDEQSA